MLTNAYRYVCVHFFFFLGSTVDTFPGSLTKKKKKIETQKFRQPSKIGEGAGGDLVKDKLTYAANSPKTVVTGLHILGSEGSRGVQDTPPFQIKKSQF